jgi:hypothetical protein
MSGWISASSITNKKPGAISRISKSGLPDWINKKTDLGQVQDRGANHQFQFRVYG